MYPEDVMKPRFSTRANDIIARFEQIHVISIVAGDTKRRVYSYKRRDIGKPRVRPKTTGHIANKTTRWQGKKTMQCHVANYRYLPKPYKWLWHQAE